MKKILSVLLMMMSLQVFAEVVSVKVSGMVCSMCAQGIQKKFKAAPQVKNLDVNLDTKIVTLHTAEGTDVADSVITNLIKEAGYNVERIERK